MAQFATAGITRPSNSALDAHDVLLLANPEIPWRIRASTSKRHVLSGAVCPAHELGLGDGPERHTRAGRDHALVRAGLGDDQHRLTLRHTRQLVADPQECPVCRWSPGELAANVEVVAATA